MPTITQLPVASAISAADDFVIVQSGVTKQITASLVTSLIHSTMWINVTSGAQTLVSNTAYVANSSSGSTAFTLPLASSFGDVIFIVGRQTGWSIAQRAGQKINVGSLATTVGVGGSVASTNAHDIISLVCTVANTEWTANSIIGNLTIV